MYKITLPFTIGRDGAGYVEKIVEDPSNPVKHDLKVQLLIDRLYILEIKAIFYWRFNVSSVAHNIVGYRGNIESPIEYRFDPQ
jgi:hypothetical protein